MTLRFNNRTSTLRAGDSLTIGLDFDLAFGNGFSVAQNPQNAHVRLEPIEVVAIS